MIRFIAGMFFCLVFIAAWAWAYEPKPTDTWMNVLMVGGESPTHKARTIQVDEDGYAICSPEKKP